MSYMTQNLIRRGHTWYVRYIVPTAQRDVVGKREIVRTLKTRDLDEARKRRHAALAEIIEQCDSLVDPLAAKVAIQMAPLDQQETLGNVVDDHIDHLARTKGNEAARHYAAAFTGKSIPVSEAAKQYASKKEGTVTNGTLQGRLHASRLFIKSMGDLLVSDITPTLALKWLEDHLEPLGKSENTLSRYIDAMKPKPKRSLKNLV